MGNSTAAHAPRQRHFGQVHGHEEHAGFALTRLHHPLGRRIPFHPHRNAYFCLLVSGGYAERFGSTDIEYRPRSVLFHPPGIEHRDEIAPGGASFLIVELDEALFLRARRLGAALTSQQDLRGGPLAQAAWRLERECRADRSPLIAEGLVLEMLGQVARPSQRSERGDLPWLDRVVERLHGEFDRRLTLDELAREAGVHPVRLSRAFRRRMRVGVGEYVRELRVSFARERLRDRDLPLALIAAESGFVDQSHMTRAFVRVLGRTPGRLRAIPDQE